MTDENPLTLIADKRALVTDTEVVSLGLGLKAVLTASNEPRAVVESAPQPKVPACKYGHPLNLKDTATIAYAGVAQTVFYFCARCKLYHDPQTGKRLGSR